MDIFARQQAKPFFLVLIRLVVMAALALATYGVLRVTGISRDFPPTDTIYFPFVTIICGVVIWRTFRQYKASDREGYCVGAALAGCHIYPIDYHLDGGNVPHVWCRHV